jgi:hypothetical protein
MSSPNTKKIIIGVVALLAVLGGVYFYFSGGSDAIPVDLIVPSDNQPVGQDIIDLVAKVDSLSIESSLFSSTLFTNLKDASVPITPEAQGRPNPFAIIGLEVGSFLQGNVSSSLDSPR